MTLNRFIAKCLIFLIPVAALFAFPLFIFIVSGELLPVSTIVARQESGPKDLIYLSAFTGINEKQYKVLQTLRHDPEIIVFGRSRTLTLRSDFFKPNATFYNAGVPMHRASELSEYVSQIPETGKLKVMLLDLSNFFKDDPVPEESVKGGTLWTGIDLFLTSGWREAYIQYAKGKFTLSQLIREKIALPSIGMSALIRHEGYRNDGSLSRGSNTDRAALVAKVPSLIEQDLESIVPGHMVPTYDSSLSEQNAAEIGRFLDLCQKRGVYVVGYLSPYAYEVYQKIQAMDGTYGEQIHAVPKTLTALFAAHGYHFYDLRDLHTVGSSDAELYDVGHPTEKATLRVLRYLSAQEPKLSTYVDATSISKKIDAEAF